MLFVYTLRLILWEILVTVKLFLYFNIILRFKYISLYIT